MAEQDDTLVPLLAALQDLVAWLQDAHVPGTLIGGVAASLLGRPRVTRDIDALVCTKCEAVSFEPGGAQALVEAVNSLFALAKRNRQHKGKLASAI